MKLYYVEGDRRALPLSPTNNWTFTRLQRSCSIIYRVTLAALTLSHAEGLGSSQDRKAMEFQSMETNLSGSAPCSVFRFQASTALRSYRAQIYGQLRADPVPCRVDGLSPLQGFQCIKVYYFANGYRARLLVMCTTQPFTGLKTYGGLLYRKALTSLLLVR